MKYMCIDTWKDSRCVLVLIHGTAETETSKTKEKRRTNKNNVNQPSSPISGATLKV
jgi:hypothetical protein